MHLINDKKFLLLSFSIILLSFTNSFSQDSHIKKDLIPVKIDSIKISGNKITEEFIIFRELNFSVGDTLTPANIKFNEERVFSLGLFYKVSFNILTENEINILNIDVKESWYIYPIPFLNIPDGDWNRISYGGYLLWKNFRGRNETLKFVASFGYDPSFSFAYYNPVFIENTDINFMVGGYYQSIQNKSPNAELIYGGEFEYDSFGAFVQIGNRINIFNEYNVSAQYYNIKAPIDSNKGITASNSEIDSYPSISFSYSYDTRDLKQFPQEGMMALFSISNKGLGFGKINYNLLRFDLRDYYKYFKKLTFKYRATSRILIGEDLPYYDYSRLGIGEIVRGHRNDIREGEIYVLGSIEASYPIIENWHFSIKLPILPRSLTSARISLKFNIYADAGNAFNFGDRLDLKSFYSGYGVGLNLLLLPYNSFRLEYALNEYGVGQWLIGTGFSF